VIPLFNPVTTPVVLPVPVTVPTEVLEDTQVPELAAYAEPVILVVPIGPLNTVLDPILIVGNAFTVDAGIVMDCAMAPVEVIEIVPVGAEVAAAVILTKIDVLVTEPELCVNVIEEE
jgi:hypothetical protein